MPSHRDAFRWSRRRFLGAGGMAAAGLTFGGWGSAGVLRAATLSGSDPAAAESGGAVADGGSLAELKPLLQELVREMERKVPYASALLLRQQLTGYLIDDRTREIEDRFPSQGAVFTIYNGAWLEEAATSDLSPDNLRAVASALARSARRQNGDGRAIDPGEGGDRHYRTECQIDPSDLPLEERFERLVDLHRRIRAVDSSLVNCQIDQVEGVNEEVFVNRAKAWSQEIRRVRCDLSLFSSDGHRTVQDSEELGGTGGLELLEVTDDRLAVLAEETRGLLTAGRVDPGSYEVVVDGNTAGTLAHESFGHGVEIDMFLKDRALAEHFVGKRVGSELVNIVDDPSLPQGFGSYFFDQEGELAKPTLVVEDGIFRRGLSDLMSAHLLDVPRSSNGRRQDFSRKTYARMSNTFFARGTGSREELIGGVKHGLLLEKLTHGMEDPKGWGIMLGIRIGREIREGRLTGRLFSPIGLTGYVPDVLASVDAVADDFSASPGICGKGWKEYVPISTGGPHIRFTARLS
jgi:TldD protein